ncbi:tRNA (adenosine(37)-N6)-dimethylallyltransferase MiaA [Amylibacter sp. SFDW26]|uniref:tRNA (adenosine(37)-N6)-dimethylallyltransferase MiaA n=1 Tax=Amylibacter sp. SFDW26 TaxID=2652722 RepID=UPI00126140CA|nr:tRNA (adenosine(37)-N6)-dimethylallyltransferase MiaA [Amylibacter sp. SFDW26]KAB7615876.1 tRNA (adenosine(37)-N6)-dimethylallyltransferase MiaA [Amylibacter sp. SFDW26]
MTALLSDTKPILIAGPTASGKSSLAINIAQHVNGAIINADALQVYEGWSILSARPPQEDLDQCPHYMYGHVAMDHAYSAGEWLRDVQEQINACLKRGERPIIVGGTGLYFSALTQGLAHIPEVPETIRAEANQMVLDHGRNVFSGILEKDDPETYARIDTQNPARTQRAWEVLKATGISLSEWQDQTDAPFLPEGNMHLFSLTSDTDWLNERIDRRFDIMLDLGALEECQTALSAGWWDENQPSCKAIGAKELISYLQGNMGLTEAVEAAKLQSRRYAKRQRTWFRGRMKSWKKLHLSDSSFDLQQIL